MKIAAFDSGIGGLSALVPLLRQEQGLEITYLGDLANLPYGTKSPERVRELTGANLRWLLASGQAPEARLLVLACNTASAHSLDTARILSHQKGIPVVGVIDAGCQAATTGERGAPLVVLGTSSTISSRAYARELERRGIPPSHIHSQACPLFVPLVEEALWDSPAAEWAARHYLEGHVHPGSKVILGCTHYPFLKPLLERLYPQATFIDAGAALLQDSLVKRLLSGRDPSSAPNRLRLLFTDRSIDLDRAARLLERLGLEPGRA